MKQRALVLLLGDLSPLNISNRNTSSFKFVHPFWDFN